MRFFSSSWLVCLLLVAASSNAQTGTLNQSASNIVDGTQAMYCSPPPSGTQILTYKMAYMRSFPLLAAGLQSSAFALQTINIGVTSAIKTGGPGQFIELRVYIDPLSNVTPVFSRMTKVHEESIFLPNTPFAGIVSITPSCGPILVDATAFSSASSVVIEIAGRDGIANSSHFIPGANAVGNIPATAEAYVYMDAICGPTSPTPMNVAFAPASPDLILSATYRINNLPAAGHVGSCEDFRIRSAVNTGTLGGGGTLDVKSVATGDFVTLHLDSPNGLFSGQLFDIAVELFPTLSFPAPLAPGVVVSGGPQTVLMYSNQTVPHAGSPPLLPLQGHYVAFLVPSFLGGFNLSLMFQGVSITTAARNGIYATTNGMEFQIP